ncbi:nucleolar 8-like isoform X1 [Brachionus plicatilis]|uniref:Nucleolar 8-like isoform X1 n=1 Tax=Brachionus plicatilis TaxID=10195 RepID=A0A3M7SIA0_BRAPC|nr:nucleolar 8-like isoform X1 [Brachionus plicatilis]
MDSKKIKIEESNKRRLESLKEKLNEFKNKKSLVRSSLNGLDLNDKKPKKVIFSESGSEDEEEKYMVTNSATLKAKNAIGNKKFKLIESDSDSDTFNEKDDHQKKGAVEMFESKLKLDENKANQLIYLKSKFSNDDSRFKIDDRFVEEEGGSAGKLDQEKTSKKKLKNENLNSLKILEEITGKQIIRPKSLMDKESDLKKYKLNKLAIESGIERNKIVRYDPTKPNHRVYEVKESESDHSSVESSEDERIDEKNDESESDDERIDENDESESDDEKNDESESEAKLEGEKKKGDGEKFFQVEPNIKDLFSSNDVFKFKFTDENEFDADTEIYEDTVAKNEFKNNNFMKSFGFDKSKKSNYSSSETETEEDEDNLAHKKEILRVPTKIGKNLNEKKTFLPDFDQDTQLKDAINYFCRAKDFDLENARKEWLPKRDVLVKESKKKHKKMIRIKRTKENENLLPWMNRTNNKSQIKKRKT